MEREREGYGDREREGERAKLFIPIKTPRGMVT